MGAINVEIKPEGSEHSPLEPQPCSDLESATLPSLQNLAEPTDESLSSEIKALLSNPGTDSEKISVRTVYVSSQSELDTATTEAAGKGSASKDDTAVTRVVVSQSYDASRDAKNTDVTVIVKLPPPVRQIIHYETDEQRKEKEELRKKWAECSSPDDGDAMLSPANPNTGDIAHSDSQSQHSQQTDLRVTRLSKSISISREIISAAREQLTSSSQTNKSLLQSQAV